MLQKEACRKSALLLLLASLRRKSISTTTSSTSARSFNCLSAATSPTTRLLSSFSTSLPSSSSKSFNNDAGQYNFNHPYQHQRQLLLSLNIPSGRHENVFDDNSRRLYCSGVFNMKDNFHREEQPASSSPLSSTTSTTPGETFETESSGMEDGVDNNAGGGDSERLAAIADKMTRTKNELEDKGKSLSKSDFEQVIDNEDEAYLKSPQKLDAVLSEMMEEISQNGGSDVDFCLELIDSVHSICKSFSLLSHNSKGFIIRAVTSALQVASVDSFADRDKILRLLERLIQISVTVDKIPEEYLVAEKISGVSTSSSSSSSLYDIIFEKAVLAHDPLLEPRGMILAARFGIKVNGFGSSKSSDINSTGSSICSISESSRKLMISGALRASFHVLVAKKESAITSASMAQFTSFLYALGSIGYSFSDLPPPICISIDKYINLRSFSLDSGGGGGGGDQLKRLLFALGQLDLPDDGLSLETSLQLLSMRGVMSWATTALDTSSSTGAEVANSPSALVANIARVAGCKNNTKLGSDFDPDRLFHIK